MRRPVLFLLLLLKQSEQSCIPPPRLEMTTILKMSKDKMFNYALSWNGKDSFQEFLDPGLNSDQLTKLIISKLRQTRAIVEV